MAVPALLARSLGGGFVVKVGDLQVPDFDVGDRVATDAVGADLGGAVLIGGGDEAIGAAVNQDKVLIADNRGSRGAPVRSRHRGVWFKENGNTL